MGTQNERAGLGAAAGRHTGDAPTRPRRAAPVGRETPESFDACGVRIVEG